MSNSTVASTNTSNLSTDPSLPKPKTTHYPSLPLALTLSSVTCSGVPPLHSATPLTHVHSWPILSPPAQLELELASSFLIHYIALESRPSITWGEDSVWPFVPSDSNNRHTS